MYMQAICIFYSFAFSASRNIDKNRDNFYVIDDFVAFIAKTQYRF